MKKSFYDKTPDEMTADDKSYQMALDSYPERFAIAAQMAILEEVRCTIGRYPRAGAQKMAEPVLAALDQFITPI